MKPPLLRHRAKILFFLAGIGSTIWFLIRVIPKPSRAAYPCMRTAAPIMSAFILYLLGLSGSVVAFRKAASKLVNARFLSSAAFLLLGVMAVLITLVSNRNQIRANGVNLIENNQPVGEGRGIFPGRVIWEWDPDATNENCTNEFGDAWDLPANTNATLVDSMFSSSVMKLTGTTDAEIAWDSIFVYFNRQHGKPGISYQDGEKIFIKTNFVGGHRARMDEQLARIPHSRYGNSQTSPQIILAVLRHLIDVCGIAQENIYVGDPSKNMYKNTYDMLHTPYPDVHYVAEFEEMGRIKAVPGDQPVLFYSDQGTILGKSSDYLCRYIEEADYLINISALKGHARAGVTLCAKNHFGSHMSDNASHLHPGLVSESGGYGRYRVLVDMMAHEKLGRNTLLFLIDGLWSGPDANLKPDKWNSYPFNGDWTSSILISQDQVALESVCYDLLKNEYTVENSEYPYPQMEGTDDYLIQAADSSRWPDGIVYDPEGDGSSFYSLGVHEHWNNPYDMQYSRNLGQDRGIELIRPEFDQSYLAAPSNLTATVVSGNHVELTWSDETESEDHFIIEYSVGTYNNFQIMDTAQANATTFTTPELGGRLTYYFRVKAVGTGSESEYSNMASVYLPETTSVRNSENPSGWKVYPNPTNGILKLETGNSYEGEISICIYTSNGKVCHQEVFMKAGPVMQETILLPDMKAGLYYLSVYQKKTQNKKKKDIHSTTYSNIDLFSLPGTTCRCLHSNS